MYRQNPVTVGTGIASWGRSAMDKAQQGEGSNLVRRVTIYKL